MEQASKCVNKRHIIFTQLLPVMSSRISGAVPTFLLYAFTACTRTILLLLILKIASSKQFAN